MFSTLAHWIDQNHAQTGAVAVARVRMQHLVALLLATVGLFYLVLFEYLNNGWSTFALLPCVLAGPVILFSTTRRGHVGLGGHLFSLVALTYITASLFARGGMHSNSAAWFLILPVMATFMNGPRAGVFMGGITAIMSVVCWAAEAAGMPMEPGFSPKLMAVMPAVDYPIICLVVGALMGIQASLWSNAEQGARDAAHARYTFLATMSHEIRTPLNGVLALTDVLLDSDLDPDQTKLATTVRSSGTLLRALLDDVLDYSKIDSEQMQLEPVSLSPSRLCEDVLELWTPTAKERGLTLSVSTDPSVPPWVVGDTTKLKQILGNLVSNAIKFTDSGAVQLRIHARDSRLQFAVVDTGIGMESAAMDNIFEAFRQADGTITRRYGGTGLGLAISRKLARLMTGDLTVTSIPGQGSTFTLDIPLTLGTAPSSVAPTQIETSALAGLRVLVAEDNPVNQFVATRLLERMGVEVLMADNGEACVELWASEHPDLILMDCQMPICDGLDAARIIRGKGGTLPIIALTANSMPGDRARSLAAGMNAHLGKPINPDELAVAMHGALPNHRMSA